MWGQEIQPWCRMIGSRTDRRSSKMANTADSGMLPMSVPRPWAVFSYVVHCSIDWLHEVLMKISELHDMGRNISPYWNSKPTQPASR